MSGKHILVNMDSRDNYMFFTALLIIEMNTTEIYLHSNIIHVTMPNFNIEVHFNNTSSNVIMEQHNFIYLTSSQYMSWLHCELLASSCWINRLKYGNLMLLNDYRQLASLHFKCKNYIGVQNNSSFWQDKKHGLVWLLWWEADNHLRAKVIIKYKKNKLHWLIIVLFVNAVKCDSNMWSKEYVFWVLKISNIMPSKICWY